jgi:hypothetical protein
MSARAPLALLVLVALACAKEQPSSHRSALSPEASVTTAKGQASTRPTPRDDVAAPAPQTPSNVGAPMKLTASTLADARLENTSRASQFVLHTPLFQASRLRIQRRDGSEIIPQDERDREKFDNTVRRETYTELAAGQKLELFSSRIKAQGSVFELNWGPFTYLLEPGRYDVVIEWQSARADYLDDAGKRQNLANVWLGTLESPHFELKLP